MVTPSTLEHCPNCWEWHNPKFPCAQRSPDAGGGDKSVDHGDGDCAGCRALRDELVRVKDQRNRYNLELVELRQSLIEGGPPPPGTPARERGLHHRVEALRAALRAELSWRP